MNAVLLTSRVRKKIYDGIIKEMMDFSIVNAITVAKGMSASKIEALNPHCVIIDYSVKFKDIDFEGFVCLLKLKTPDVRLIYNFGTVDNVEDEQFKKSIQFLLHQKVNDIIIDDSEIKATIENPLKFGDINEKIDTIIKEKEKLIFKNESEFVDLEKQKIESKPVELNFFSLSENYSFDIENVTEIIDGGEINKENCIIVSIMQMQHHLGCTRTAFELANLLQNQKKNPCVVMGDDETYKNMLNYYKYKTTAAAEGFSLGNIHVLPYTALERAKKNYTHVILDIGYFRPQYEPEYRKSDIKIMMCSSAEWDLIHISRWLNYPKYDYTREINYLFPSSKQRFIQLNKSLLKGNCTSNRIDYNDATHNKKVYGSILKHYGLNNPNKQEKRKLMKLK